MKKKWKTKTKTWKKKKIKNKSKERKQENRINFHKKLCFMNFEWNNYCGDIHIHFNLCIRISEYNVQFDEMGNQ